MTKPHPSLSELISPAGIRKGEPPTCPNCGHFPMDVYPWYDGNGNCCHCGTPAAHLPVLLEKLAHQSSLNVEADA